uniref:Putative selt/selw/selh selenoprotein n=1 Tax=Nyssomyia neivai TaxID=330878 RepID=A0A1L8E4I4_9DIPT
MERVQVHVEYCGLCNYETKCEALQKNILNLVPNAHVHCIKGRQGMKGYIVSTLKFLYEFYHFLGSFEVQINEKVVYSKLSTLAFPDFDDIAQSVEKQANGENLGCIRQQAITDCVLQ